MSDSKYTPLEDENDEDLLRTNSSDFEKQTLGRVPFIKSKKFKILVAIAIISTLIIIAAIIFTFVIKSEDSKKEKTYSLNPQWNSDIQIGYNVTWNGKWGNITGHIWMDKTNKKFRADILQLISIIYKEKAAYTIMKFMGDCQYNITRFDKSFPDIFSLNLNWTFVNETNYYTSSHKKQSCDLFKPALPLEPLKAVSFCLEDGNEPIFLQITNSTTQTSDYVTFQNFKSGSISNATFDVPDGCELIHDGPFKPPGGGGGEGEGEGEGGVPFHHIVRTKVQHLLRI